jgi:hypothetical protein
MEDIGTQVNGHMNTIIERQIEAYLVDEVAKLGGIAEKVVALGGRGFFDRIVILPGGRTIFAEVKKPRGSRVSPHQKLRHKLYLTLGVEVAVLKTKRDVDAVLTAKDSGA